MPGAAWTSKLQGVVEATRYTPIAATRICADLLSPVMPTWKYDKIARASQRASLHPLFDPPITGKYNVDVPGLKLRPTFESLPWWLQGAIKGGVTGVMTNTSVYTYTFSPTGTADDRKSFTLEVGNDTAAYQIGGALISKLNLGFYADKAMALDVDLTAQNFVTQAFTPALSPAVWEEINGSLFKGYVDPTTIGTTLDTGMTDAQLAITLPWTWVWVGDGNLYPAIAVPKAYSAKLTYTTFFDDTAALVAQQANTYRKVRVSVQGTTIAASSPTTTKSVTVDWYGYFTDATVQVAQDLWMVKSTGEATFDATASTPFSVTVANALVTLP
jgi:hypothetical protein